MSAPAADESLLLVEDDRALRSTLAAFLRRQGYRVEEAEDGERALAQLASHRVEALLCDIRMSGMSGIDLLPKALAADPDLAVIMLTGVDEPAAAISCLKLGAADYLIKPVDLEELHHALRSALRKRELEVERRQMEQWLTREVAVRTRELEEQSHQLAQLSVSVLAALVDALEAKDPHLHGHSQRVAELSARLAVRLGARADDVERVRMAARLHDIGKLVLREPDIASVPAPGGDPEFGGLPEDPDLALRILDPVGPLRGVAEMVRFQHERFDGKGVPEGRRGEEIPLGSRIIAAASLYDELATGTEGRSPEPHLALDSLRALVGLMLDPRVFAALEQEAAAP